MQCPKCKSTNVTVQAVGNVRSKGKGCLYWLLIGWWLELILWLCFTIPMIFAKLFGGGKKVQTTVESHAICQNCGYSWKC